MTKRTFSAVLLSSALLTGCGKAPTPEAAPPTPQAAPPSQEATSAAPTSKATAEASGVSLVKEGKAASAFVLPAGADASIKDEANYFIGIVEKATGAKIPIVEDASTLPDETIRIYLGPSEAASKAGLEVTSLQPETYQIKTIGNAIYLIGAADGREMKGNPKVASKPTRWALTYLLDKHLKVRWLWPGDLGTYIPKTTTFTIPQTDLTFQPKLEYRSLRLLASTRRQLISRNKATDEALTKEALHWAENHLMGSRSVFTFGHNFGHWWEKYSKDHPDYFAELPPTLTQPYPKPGAVKLRLANPAVIEQIAKEYEEAGKPTYWNVCPNDGSGFDISAETRAWDIPQNQPIADIVQARGNLTARYVKFWNLLYERLKQINPDVILVTYAYSSYRYAPPAERPLTAKSVIQIVDSVTAFDNWNAWSANGADLFLRPNWWHQGADAPYITMKKSDKFIRFAYDHRMLGLDMDSILGYWATQGPNYYHVARLMAWPELTLDEIVNEYTDAFGAGKEEIKKYLSYWEEIAGKYNYTLNAADEAASVPSEYHKLVKAGKVSRSILNGSKYVLPYLYTDEVLAPAVKLLDEAEAKIGNPESEEARRVAFLRKGLDAMKATRAQVVAGQALKGKATKEQLAAFEASTKALEAYREELAKEHVVWAESTNRYEERYHILLRPSAFERNEINLDGY